MKKLFVLILSLCMVLTASGALGESVKVGTNAEFPPLNLSPMTAASRGLILS